ncbi:hypothetical protein EIP86_010440 [Pleurotus ostreatoroseus]|nr:hypothetical protein EIP86_010440 [Pleurotus ostreatoroseus]
MVSKDNHNLQVTTTDPHQPDQADVQDVAVQGLAGLALVLDNMTCMQGSRDLIRYLRTKSSTFAPVSRLPAETLGWVFEIYVADYQTTFEEVTPRPEMRLPPKGWFAILHVCREWRHVALSTPQLWTCISPARHEFARLALVHSGQLPLTIPSCGPDGSASAYYPLLRELPRVRLIHFHLAPQHRHFFAKVESILNLEAPMLEELSVSGTVGKTEIPVVSKLGMAHLATLKLQGVSLSILKSLVRPSLTVLDLYATGIRPHDLVGVFSQMPLLQRLELCGYEPTANEFIPGFDEPPPVWHRTVHLPHLKYLSMQCAPNGGMELAQLLCCLSFPLDTEIVFNAYEVDYMRGARGGVFEIYEDVLPFFLSKAAASDSTTATFRPRVVCVEGNDLLHVTLWSGLRSKDLFGYPVNPVPVCRLQMFIHSNELESIEVLFELLDLSEVKVLEIDDVTAGVDFWMEVFQDNIFPKLETIRLHKENTIEVVGALEMLVRNDPPVSHWTPDAGTEDQQTDDQLPFAMLPALMDLQAWEYGVRTDPDSKPSHYPVLDFKQRRDGPEHHKAWRSMKPRLIFPTIKPGSRADGLAFIKSALEEETVRSHENHDGDISSHHSPFLDGYEL